MQIGYDKVVTEKMHGDTQIEKMHGSTQISTDMGLTENNPRKSLEN